MGLARLPCLGSHGLNDCYSFRSVFAVQADGPDPKREPMVVTS